GLQLVKLNPVHVVSRHCDIAGLTWPGRGRIVPGTGGEHVEAHALPHDRRVAEPGHPEAEIDTVHGTRKRPGRPLRVPGGAGQDLLPAGLVAALAQAGGHEIRGPVKDQQQADRYQKEADQPASGAAARPSAPERGRATRAHPGVSRSSTNTHVAFAARCGDTARTGNLTLRHLTRTTHDLRDFTGPGHPHRPVVPSERSPLETQSSTRRRPSLVT